MKLKALPNLDLLNKLASNRRGKVKLGLLGLELALGGVIAYNVLTAKPGSSLKPATITAPKNLPGATAVSTVPVNPPDKLVVTMTPGGGTYTKNVTIKLSSNVPCRMFWNAHGKDPRGPDGEPYTGPVVLAGPEGGSAVYRMRFYGVHDFGIRTGVGAADFTIKRPRPLDAVFDQIGREEARFGSVQGRCSNASCYVRLGTGDCWADSEWLFNRLNGAGIPARIMAYKGGGNRYNARCHAWVQYNLGDGWKEFPYRRWGGKHFGDVGAGTPYVIIGPSKNKANMLSTGYYRVCA